MDDGYFGLELLPAGEKAESDERILFQPYANWTCFEFLAKFCHLDGVKHRNCFPLLSRVWSSRSSTNSNDSFQSRFPDQQSFELEKEKKGPTTEAFAEAQTGVGGGASAVKVFFPRPPTQSHFFISSTARLQQLGQS